MLTAEEQQALRDFLSVLDVHQGELDAAMLKTAAEHPEFSKIVRSMGQEQLDEQNRASRALVRAAIQEDQWLPLLDNLRTQGAAYARMGISFTGWFDLLSSYQSVLTPLLLSQQPGKAVSAVQGMTHYVGITMAIIGEAYLRTKEAIITQQQSAIRELSTPILQVRDRLLILPIIGVIDTLRARQLTEQLLHAIRAHRARVVVMDITGVAAVDSKVANHLLQTIAAARLMGAKVVITGVSSDVAHSLVGLGVDIGQLNATGDLQSGLEEGERLLGYRVARLPDAPGGRE